MYVESVPNRNSPPAVLLRESSRLDGRIVKRTLANLSHWPPAQVDALRRVSPSSLPLRHSRFSARFPTAMSPRR